MLDPQDLSFGEEDNRVKDTSNQSLMSVQSKGLDQNMNYGPIYEQLELESLPAAVRPPALGSRGYRPNLVAIGYGERMPGGGALLEYSFNRLGVGVAGSSRSEDDLTRSNFGHAYVTYRWLPFRASPYLLMGVGAVHRFKTEAGLLMGAGIEAQVFYGLNLLLGYTYFSNREKGYAGGAIGWAF